MQLHDMGLNMKILLDKHAPLIQRRAKMTRSEPWEPASQEPPSHLCVRLSVGFMKVMIIVIDLTFFDCATVQLYNNQSQISILSLDG